MVTEKKQFEIMKHALVPLHTIISEEEKKKLFKNRDIKPDQLPKILDVDPAVISIGAKPGQIVKVIRKSCTAKESVAYRFVVENNK